MGAHGDLEAGELFAGDFEVVRRLGAGGMGEVYQVLQRSTGRQRALKRMHAELVRDPRARERFLLEARIGAAIASEHVVEVIAAGVDERRGEPWLCMELLEGEDLAARIGRRGPMSANEASRVLAELGHALRAAHAAGVVHRDVKPENVFLARARRQGADDTVKLLDLGIARLVADGGPQGTAALGTPLWMAPEQAERGEIRAAADVWALGLLAFLMLVGRSYWRSAEGEGAGIWATIREVLLDPLEPASTRARALGWRGPLVDGFDGWFAACVVRDPSARFAEAGAAVDAFSDLVRGAPVSRAAALDATAATVDVRELLKAHPVSPTAAAPASTTTTSAALRSGRRGFVGRDLELGELLSGLDEAIGGRGGLFLLVGEPGIGKTRLADELARAAGVRGLLTVWGRAWEAGGTPAYWPWRQVFRAILRERGESALRGRCAASLADLAPLVPELGQPGPGPAVVDADDARFRLFDAAAIVLREAAAAAPIVVLLDDLHAADPSSLSLLHFISRQLAGARALVVATTREHDDALSPDKREVLGRIAREGARLDLGRLTRGDIVNLVQGTDQSAGADELAAAVFTASEGNPLFVGELLRLIAGERPREAGDPLMIPESVREVIRARLRGVDPEVRSILEMMSIVGRECELALVAAASEASLDAIEGAARAAAAAGILVPRASGRGIFTHILFRDTLHADLLPGRRAALHAAVADVLERRGEGSRSGDVERLGELAHHRLEAAAVVGAEAAIHAALRAARRADELLAYEEAAAILERAQRILGPGDERLRLTVAVTLARILIQGGESLRGQALCRGAAELARSLGDAEAFAEAALVAGHEYQPGFVDAPLVALLQESLTRLPAGDSPLRARVMSRLAAAMFPCADFGSVRDLAFGAVAIARRLDDPETLRMVIDAALSVLISIGTLDERLALGAEVLALAAAAGDRLQVWRNRSRVCFDLLESGDLAGGRAMGREFIALSREFRLPKYRIPALLIDRMDAQMEGRWSDADALREEILATAADPHDRVLRLRLMRQRYTRAIDTADRAEFATLRRELEALTRGVSTWMAFFGPWVALLHLELRVGDLEGLRRSWASKLEAGLEGIVSAGGLSALACAELAAHVGDPALIERMYTSFRQHPQGLITGGPAGMTVLGPIAAALAPLAAALGRADDASKHYEEAIEVVTRAGMRPALAWCCFNYAVYLAAQGGAGGRIDALRAQAAALADELDLAGLHERLAE